MSTGFNGDGGGGASYGTGTFSTGDIIMLLLILIIHLSGLVKMEPGMLQEIQQQIATQHILIYHLRKIY